MNKLLSDTVEKVFVGCLYEAGEDHSKALRVKGVTLEVGFHPERIKNSEKVIKEFIKQLPSGFTEKAGMSFLNACEDNHGNFWTGIHRIVDQLVCLGLAINVVEFTFPRERWSNLPGGMPYFKIVNLK